MTRKRLDIVLAIVILLAIGLTAARSQQAYNHASSGISRNCHNVTRLAKIEHTTTREQTLASKALLAEGITFNIPKDKLPRLVRDGEARSAKFLEELDELATESCN